MIPSTLTVGIPLVALLALALAPIPSSSRRTDRQLTRLHELHSLPEHEQDTMLLRSLRISRLVG